MPDTQFVCDGARVAHEEVDGEVIAIDFATGAYFSMNGSAAQIWRHLVAGGGEAEVSDAAAAAADDPAAARAATVAFVDALIDASLLRRSHAPTEPLRISFAAFQPPVLEKFEDMADLIALDPIHEVSEAGWPHSATAA